eukprot:403361127
MRLKPTDQSYSVSEIPFDSPAPSDKKANQPSNLNGVIDSNQVLAQDQSIALVSQSDLQQINQQADALDISAQNLRQQHNQQNMGMNDLDDEETISAIQHYNQNISATHDQIKSDMQSSIMKHDGDDDIDHELANDQNFVTNQDQSMSQSQFNDGLNQSLSQMDQDGSKQNFEGGNPSHYNTVSQGIQGKKQTRLGRDPRQGYRGGQLKMVYKTKKSKYVQDGAEMLQVQKEFKQQQDKIQILQRRILALQRQDEKSKKKIEEVKNQEILFQTSNQTQTEIKQSRMLLQERKQQEIKEKRDKVSEIRQRTVEIKEKLKMDIQNVKIQKKHEIIQSQTEIDQQLREKQIEMRMEKERKIQEVKQQKEKAAKKRQRQELQFLGRIQHQYHKEKDQKAKMKDECHEVIAQLEQEEQKLFEQLKNTQMIEKSLKIRNFTHINTSLFSKNTTNQYSPTTKSDFTRGNYGLQQASFKPKQAQRQTSMGSSIRNSITSQGEVSKQQIHRLSTEKIESQTDKQAINSQNDSINTSSVPVTHKTEGNNQLFAVKRGLMVRYSNAVQSEKPKVQQETERVDTNPFEEKEEQKQVNRTTNLAKKTSPARKFDNSPSKSNSQNFIQFSTPLPSSKGGISVYQKSQNQLLKMKTQKDAQGDALQTKEQISPVKSSVQTRQYNVSRSPMKSMTASNTKAKLETDKALNSSMTKLDTSNQLQKVTKKIQSSQPFAQAIQKRNQNLEQQTSGASSIQAKQAPSSRALVYMRNQKEYSKLQLKSSQLSKQSSPTSKLNKSSSQGQLVKSMQAQQTQQQNQTEIGHEATQKKRRSTSRSLNNSMDMNAGGLTVQDKVRRSIVENANQSIISDQN